MAPDPQAQISGPAQLGIAFDPAAHQTLQWLLRAGHSVDGIVYNSHVIASRRIWVELDLEAMIAWYFEESDFDDG